MRPQASSPSVEHRLYGDGRLADLDEYYRERVLAARSPAEKLGFLHKRAHLAEHDFQNRVAARALYEEILTLEPAGGPAARWLRLHARDEGKGQAKAKTEPE